ncbi:MAG: DUF4230 domain-containing protein [Akkermansia sp.]|nr:DUF4230 domain-containing protein [Akkermansia sp.]
MAQENKSNKWGCITVMFLIAALTALAWKGMDETIDIVKRPIDIVEAIGKGITNTLDQVLNHYRDVVIVRTEKGRNILELTTYEKEIESEHEYTNTSWGSTKRIKYTRKYTAKYGADLTQTPVNGDLRIEYKIIVASLTPNGEPDIESENGWWNKLTDEERAKVEYEAEEYAKRVALKDHAAVQIAEQRIDKFIQEKYGENGKHKVYRN